MDEMITLSNGREFHETTVIESERNLFVYINDREETLKTVFDDLYESDGTDEITSVVYGTERTYTGYTVLIAVRKEPMGQITATLAKGA